MCYNYAMTQDDYLALLARLGLSHPEVAELLGIHRVTSHKYASGARKIPERTAKLLRYLELSRASPRKAMQRLG